MNQFSHFKIIGVEKSDEGLYTVLADNGRGLPADARVTLKVDNSLERQIPGIFD